MPFIGAPLLPIDKMATRHSSMFPFVAIVGQDQMKKALLLNVIDPGIGGVLIKGEKGTAKSTTVRALEQVLPPRKVIKGCPFGCDPAHPAENAVDENAQTWWRAADGQPGRETVRNTVPGPGGKGRKGAAPAGTEKMGRRESLNGNEKIKATVQP